MGNNPSRNPFRRARVGLDDQQAVDEYKARSVWGAWWALDESVRRRYFSRDERAFITRYGSRLDELATMRDSPRTDREKHFVAVCHRRRGADLGTRAAVADGPARLPLPEGRRALGARRPRSSTMPSHSALRTNG